MRIGIKIICGNCLWTNARTKKDIPARNNCRVVFRKLDQDWWSILDYADPGLRLRKHFISERWIETILDQSTVDLAIQDWANPGLMFSQNLAFWNAFCWVSDVKSSVVVPGQGFMFVVARVCIFFCTSCHSKSKVSNKCIGSFCRCLVWANSTKNRLPVPFYMLCLVL